MRTLLDTFSAPATRAPRLTLAVLAVITVLLGLATPRLEVSTSFGAFAPADGVAAALGDIDERFGASESLQILVDAGPGGDVLDPEGLAAGQRLRDTLTSDADVARWLAPDGVDRPAVVTYATPFSQAGASLGVPVGDLDAATLDAVTSALLDDPEVGPQVETLLSQDLTRGPARARAGLAVVDLAPGLDDGEVRQASRDVRAVLPQVDAPGLRLAVFSEEVVEQAAEDAVARDVPLLLALSLLLVVATLAVLFRTVSDVVIGMIGLVASIVWMAGTAALLGPGGLGLLGPFNQVAIAVPVLLVGLGVDYSVHLTTRYREQQRRGEPPTQAARTALRTVGIALVLATAATVGGFLSNVASPLPPIADFGVFASVGILAAFLVLGLLVPAARVLLDQRPGARLPRVARSVAGRHGTSSGRLVGVGTALATRAPKAVVAGTAALVLVAGVGAAGIGTEFQERDFLPAGSSAERTIDRLSELFGGRVGEQTYVLVDGDVTDPDLLEAVAAYEGSVGVLDAVRTIGGRTDAVSPFEVVDRLVEVGQRARDQLSTDLRGWADPAAVAAELELPDRLDRVTVAERAADGDELDEVPTDIREAIARRLPADRAPSAALATTASEEELREVVVAQRRDDLVAARPAGIDTATLRTLADLPADRLRLDRLEAAGFPADLLADDERQAIATLDALEDAGWSADRDEVDGTSWRAQLDVASDRAPREVAAARDGDGLLLTLSTRAGQRGADELAAALVAAGDDVRAAGGELTVVSSSLVQAEVISSLADAQLLAILISVAVAGLLLVVASWVSDRSVALGVIGIVPAAVALILALGTMRLLGMSFNALTATVASIAVGIGVPYGIHLTNRFRASFRASQDPTAAIADTLRHTGGALVGSAITTGLAFGVLLLSSSTPMRQFGGVSAMMIAYALLVCLVVQPALLVWWARRRARGCTNGGGRSGTSPARRATRTAVSGATD